jgi:glycosyltransferase involved in cell wall biosynthesis
VIADGDVLSLAHMLHSRSLAGEDPIMAARELAWAVRYLNLEVQSLRKATCVVVPSSREVRFVSRFVQRPVRMVRNMVSDLVDLSAVRPAAGAPMAVLFMGDMRFAPNRHAARFLARDVWPRLRRRLDGAIQPKLLLGGWEASSLVGDSVPAGDADVIVRSDVAEVTDLFNECRIVAVPVFFGGGSPHKVMEAAASGRPVICSTYVASTLEAVDESGFFVCDSADDYARHLTVLLSDHDLACRRQAQAREWAITHYSIDAWIADVNELGRTIGVGELVSR